MQHGLAAEEGKGRKGGCGSVLLHGHLDGLTSHDELRQFVRRTGRVRELVVCSR